MCGQYYLERQVLPEQIKKYLPKERIDFLPSQDCLCLIYHKNRLSLTKVKWGMESYDSSLVINARVETYKEKKMFQNSLPCLVLASGFYAFDHLKRRIRIKDNHLLYFAGIIKNQRLCILTQESNEILKAIHPRMPIFIQKEGIDNWLKEEVIKKDFIQLEVEGTYQERLF